MSDTIISVENLGKAYRIGLKEEIPDTFVGALQSWIKAPITNFKNLRRLDTSSDNGDDDDIIWAVKDVSFDVKQGEVLGIIGRNGAGKSTLLKILSRITEPTTGRAVIHGRVSSLLEVGTGFHPELSGRENVYMNGTILGMTKKEIDRKFDEIVDFSGIGKFLDTPIKRYSSGMKVRLAFAVAAHLDPEILIIDEVLAVGDAEFQKKCLGKMKDVAGQGRTVIFVSHNMMAVRNLCSRGILIQNGEVVHKGDVNEIVSQYLAPANDTTFCSDLSSVPRDGSGLLQIQSIEVTDDGGHPLLSPDHPAVFKMRIVAKSSSLRSSNVLVAIAIANDSGERLLEFSTEFDPGFLADNVKIPEQFVLACRTSSLPLRSGYYYLTLYLAYNGAVTDRIQDCIRIEIDSSDFYGTGRLPSITQGSFMLPHKWAIESLVSSSHH